MVAMWQTHTTLSGCKNIIPNYPLKSKGRKRNVVLGGSPYLDKERTVQQDEENF
jgi:hypothetical protein